MRICNNLRKKLGQWTGQCNGTEEMRRFLVRLAVAVFNSEEMLIV